MRTANEEEFMKLYGYFRSSASYRVRIALNLKGIAYEQTSIHLTSGAHTKDEFRRVNPQTRVPVLELDDGTRLLQSQAIIEYLDEIHPEPPLLPRDPLARAKVRALSQIIVADIHPLNNAGTLAYLRKKLGHDEDAVNAWYAYWITEGFNAIEPLIEGTHFCFGDRPGLADTCLIPQVANARRFNVDLTAYPKIVAIDAHCLTLPAFADARPDVQPDAT